MAIELCPTWSNSKFKYSSERRELIYIAFVFFNPTKVRGAFFAKTQGIARVPASSTQKLIDDSASPLSQTLVRVGGLNEVAEATDHAFRASVPRKAQRK